MTPLVGHVVLAADRRIVYTRRLVGAATMLATVAAFRLAARLLPAACPLRVWALSQSFPLAWRDVAGYATLAAPTLAD